VLAYKTLEALDMALVEGDLFNLATSSGTSLMEKLEDDY
jgi:hypothetical protein